MARSPADAISRAVERTQHLLFPFNANKWFALGFTVFLAQCGEGGGGSIPNVPSGSTPSPFPSGGGGGGSSGAGFDLQRMFDELVTALGRDLPLYVTLAAVGVALTVGLWILIVWFSSRAKLMLVESVIWDRVDLGSQWTRAADLGMSLCKFRLVVGFCGGVLILGAFAGGFAAALPDLQSGDYFGTRAVIGYGVMAAALFVFGIPLALLFALLDDFVVPLMVIRNVRVGQAWNICRAEVLSGNVGGVTLFYLLRIALGFAIAVMTTFVTCLTCCLTAVPYLGTVILLPIFVFSRAFPLYYLQELGIPVFPVPEASWAPHDEWRFPK